ncbi:hypothetical protein EPD60_15565 [Flaviaesturariibacter flavus]|uniref:Peptidase M61 catalytic domain-containing protein n=1 Tax=Flaviaesturariibacter flavus TaxID=2502780 RepID=A0A4R1B859_9BACT|nr:hypothetical protein [Flaviaesturariibacter flavus]TCJ12675.1 hypothetical protein EPD60_15565 [Flaviaesturariibacter flavus]
MRVLLTLLATVFSLYILAQAPRTLSYTFSYDTAAAKPALTVDLRFRGDVSGTTVLRLPDAWASQKELWKAVSVLESKTPGVRIDSGAGPAQRLLRHAPGAGIHLRYVLQQDWDGPLLYPYNYRAVLRKEWMQATGYAFVVRPDWAKSQALLLQLDWRGMPAGWCLANSFHATGRNWQGRCTADNLDNVLLVAGDFRLYPKNIEGKPVYTAIRGKEWSFADTEMVAKTTRIIGGERNFWKQHDEPYFLVSLVPFEGGPGFNINGSALHHAFFMGMSTDSLAAAHMHALLAHEYMHRWIGIGLVLRGREEEQYWFSEGFTEYYTYKTLFQNRIIDTGEYVAAVNRTVSEYYLSPKRNAPNTAAADSFWLDRSFQRLPYVKGFTFAMYLDVQLQQKSGGKRSLDGVMKKLLSSTPPGDSLSIDRFLSAFASEGVAAGKAYQDWILAGGTVPVPPLPELRGLRFTDVNMGFFELGFDDKELKKGKPLSGVVAGSEAWKAGLRDGQLLQGMNIHFGDATKPVKISVLDNGQLKQVSYLPVHRNRVPVPQYEFTAAR